MQSKQIWPFDIIFLFTMSLRWYKKIYDATKFDHFYHPEEQIFLFGYVLHNKIQKISYSSPPTPSLYSTYGVCLILLRVDRSVSVSDGVADVVMSSM
jgi:hypothetical protein